EKSYHTPPSTKSGVPGGVPGGMIVGGTSESTPPADVIGRDGGTIYTEVDKLDAEVRKIETIRYKGTARGAMFFRHTYSYNPAENTGEHATYDFNNELAYRSVDNE